jgi:hypothetical protein
MLVVERAKLMAAKCYFGWGFYGGHIKRMRYLYSTWPTYFMLHSSEWV